MNVARAPIPMLMTIVPTLWYDPRRLDDYLYAA